MQDRGQVGCSQFRSSQEMCLLPGGHPRPTPRMWGKETGTRAGTIPTWRCCPLTAGEVQVVLPAVPGLVLAGEAAVKRGS